MTKKECKMAEQKDEIERMKSKTWYDDLCMVFAALMMAGGVVALGYGAIASISESIKAQKSVKPINASKNIEAKSIPFDTAVRKMNELAK
jgi:hypothetical protein